MSQSIHMPSRLDCSVITSAYSATRSLQRSANSASPYSSISRFEFSPSALLDPDLDPEALAVEAVLVALVEAAERLVALEDVLERPAPAWWAPIGLFAVIGPSMKLNFGPPAFRSRSRSNVPSRSQRSRTSSSRARWSGTCGSGSNVHGSILGAGTTFACATRSTLRFSQDGIEKGTDMSTAVTTQTFEEEVLQSDKPVLVDFWAEWCGPCHAVAPVLDKIAEERKDELKLVKVNIDEEQELAIGTASSSIPTIILFKDGEPAARRRRRAAQGRDRALPRPRRSAAQGFCGPCGLQGRLQPAVAEAARRRRRALRRDWRERARCSSPRRRESSRSTLACEASRRRSAIAICSAAVARRARTSGARRRRRPPAACRR